MPDDLESYIQETGCAAGRDRQPALVTYLKARTYHVCEKASEITQLMTHKALCLVSVLFSAPSLTEMNL